MDIKQCTSSLMMMLKAKLGVAKGVFMKFAARCSMEDLRQM